MSRIDDLFTRLRAEKRKAFVAYVMAGDPDIERSSELLAGLPGAGVDIIELGVPFTDPMADGPTIQLAGQRALEGGMTLQKTLDMVTAFRAAGNETPIVLMGYYNPIYNRGVDRFLADATKAGVDGLIVEGGEGGGFKNPRPVSSLVLLPLVRSRVDVPIIAAGGICDGVSMAAAFALGAEGVQMGTRMVSALESPVHEAWKNAIVEAAETDTCFLRTEGGPALRALRTSTTERLEAGEGNAMAGLGGGVRDVYFEGKLEKGVALTGQVAGRIDAVRPVAEILRDTVSEFREASERLSAQIRD